MGDQTTASCPKPLYKLVTSERSFDKFKQIAQSRGLSSNHMMMVISGIESKDFDIKVKLDLMKCLIPMKHVPAEAFVRFSCLLSNFQFSMELKVEILKWMVTVYSLLEDSVEIRSLYELFLQLLEQDALRPYICHLLYLITTEKEVTSRRVNYLNKIIRKYGSQQCLVFLLILYYKVSPTSFEEELKESIEYHFHSLGVYPDLIKHVHPLCDLNLSNVCVSTYEVSLCNTEVTVCSSVSEREKSSNESFAGHLVHELYQEFMILKKSKNVSKILKSKYRRFFLTSDIPLKNKIKIYDFIMTSLYDEKNFSSCHFLREILEIFQDMGESIFAVSDFTEMLITSWDGKSNLDIYLALLQYEPICCFRKIACKMNHLREQISNANVSTKCELLYCFSKIYENWVLMQHDRFQKIPCQGICPALEDSSGYHQPKEEIRELAKEIDFACSYLIIVDCSVDFFEPCLLNQVLLHYEKHSIIHTKRGNLVHHFLPYSVFHAALLSLSSFTLDNLCQIMLRYTAEVKQMQLNENEDAKIALKDFTLYSRDIHNLLCDQRKSSFDVFLRLKGQNPDFAKLLHLYCHPALLMKTIAFSDRYPDFRFDNIVADRKILLEYLAEEGLQSLSKFINLKYV